MAKRILPLLLTALLLAGCGRVSGGAGQYQRTYLDLFDTVTYITGLADSQAEFDGMAQAVHDALWEYHCLFDIYHEYDGMNNLKTVNDSAGGAPVAVDSRILRLLLACREYDALTGGKVNAAMGSVLSLWHDAREAALEDPEAAALPDASALAEAARHTNWDCVIIDEENGTVCLTDPEMSLDVGAIAKGWALQQVAETAPEGLLISLGGNVCATSDKAGQPWLVGVNDPDGADAYLCTLVLSAGSAVTSGDYQRYFTVDGENYNHIIDPDTLYPGTLWRSVTVVCADSGLGDALSTALFLLPLEEGLALAEQCGAEAMWVDGSGEVFYSPGFGDLLSD